MRIKCQHGYFKFFEDEPGEISKFNSLYDFGLVAKNDYYTFPFLVDAPEYSFILKPYLGIPAIANFAGEPWEVMEENKLVYDFDLGLVKPILSVIKKAELTDAGNYFVANGLLAPGSFNIRGKRVVEYSAWLSWSTFKFKYTEVIYED